MSQQGIDQPKIVGVKEIQPPKPPVTTEQIEAATKARQQTVHCDIDVILDWLEDESAK